MSEETYKQIDFSWRDLLEDDAMMRQITPDQQLLQILGGQYGEEVVAQWWEQKQAERNNDHAV